MDLRPLALFARDFAVGFCLTAVVTLLAVLFLAGVSP